jgi:hypothetical protein
MEKKKKSAFMTFLNNETTKMQEKGERGVLYHLDGGFRLFGEHEQLWCDGEGLQIHAKSPTHIRQEILIQIGLQDACHQKAWQHNEDDTILRRNVKGSERIFLFVVSGHITKLQQIDG